MWHATKVARRPGGSGVDNHRCKPFNLVCVTPPVCRIEPIEFDVVHQREACEDEYLFRFWLSETHKICFQFTYADIGRNKVV
jgi:hypothetical protein